VQDFDDKITHFDDAFVFECFRRQGNKCAFSLVAVVSFHPFKEPAAPFFELMGGIHMRQNWNTLLCPVRIAQHRMALAIFINDQFHRLISDRLNFRVQGLRQNVSRAAVDHDYAITRDDKTEVVVMARVFISGRGGGPYGGPDVRNNLNRFGIKR